MTNWRNWGVGTFWGLLGQLESADILPDFLQINHRHPLMWGLTRHVQTPQRDEHPWKKKRIDARDEGYMGLKWMDTELAATLGHNREWSRIQGTPNDPLGLKGTSGGLGPPVPSIMELT